MVSPQSQVMICHGTENVDSHLSRSATQGPVTAAGPLVLLTECVLINLSFEGLGLTEPWGVSGAWQMTSFFSLSA